MAGSSYGDNGGPVANINVTPLVDVMLVLLVIFMITAPMLQQGVEVNLPKATTAPVSGTAEQIVLSIDRQGAIYLGKGNQYTLEELPEKVKGVMENRAEADQKIFIKADTELQYGRIMEVMSRLYQAGITQIGLISAPTDEPRGRK
jgi:biopolymer transport protein TolR